VLLDVVVLAMAVVDVIVDDVIVDDVVVVAAKLHPGGTLSGSAGSVPASSSLRSGQPSWSRSTPTRYPSPGGTQV